MDIDCTFCGYTISKREPHFRSIRGFEKLRSRGGANAIFLREVKHDDRGNEIYACESCIKVKTAHMENQEVLAV